MNARLILARHGNTFRPEDTPVWIGARTDLPLVDKGIAQAQALADALRQAAIMPVAILSGPLQRTQGTARIVAEKLGIPAAELQTDTRLRELDYGKWEGLSSEAITAAGDGPELAAWNDDCEFPIGRGWQPVEGQIIAEISFILAGIADGTTLVITSNGILRFFAKAAHNAHDFPDRKVATGNACVMERDAKGDWRIKQWNQPPHLLALKD